MCACSFDLSIRGRTARLDSDGVRYDNTFAVISLFTNGDFHDEKLIPFRPVAKEPPQVVRRDLPMMKRTFAMQTPNFGDWSKGSHTIWMDRDVYPRDYYEPTDFELVFKHLRDGSGGDATFKVTVAYPLDRTSPDFADDLLFAVNLLQENVGAADILPRDAASDELLATLDLEWEVFPPGTVDEIVRRSLGRRGHLPPNQEVLVRERVTLFNRLNPLRFIQGRGGMNRYIGALFADDLAVFENVKYGNAPYVLYDDWREVSKRSRIDLLKCRDAIFDRFVHREGWQAEFVSHVRAEKKRRGIKDSDRGTGYRAAQLR